MLSNINISVFRKKTKLLSVEKDLIKMSILKIENIKKGYGKLKVLDGFSLEVKQGEIISIVGPSRTRKVYFT